MERNKLAAGPVEAPTVQAPPGDGPSLTIREFCRAERISNATYHKLRKAGNGPTTIVLAGTRAIRITSNARRDWHQKMLALSATAEAKSEERRRVDQAQLAGRLAAASVLHVSKRKATVR